MQLITNWPKSTQTKWRHLKNKTDSLSKVGKEEIFSTRLKKIPIRYQTSKGMILLFLPREKKLNGIIACHWTYFKGKDCIKEILKKIFSLYEIPHKS